MTPDPADLVRIYSEARLLYHDPVADPATVWVYLVYPEGGWSFACPRPALDRWADLVEAEARLAVHLWETAEPIEPTPTTPGFKLGSSCRPVPFDDGPDTIPFRPRARRESCPA